MGSKSHSKAWGFGAGDLLRSCSIAALCAGAASTALAATPALQTPLTEQAKAAYLAQHQLSSKHAWRILDWDPKHTPAHAAFRARFTSTGPGLTVPYWSTAITSPLDGQTYNVSMVGSSPYAPTPTNTNVSYVPVVLRIHVNGFVLDPTKPSACDSQSPSSRFFNSPLFRPTNFTSNGVNVSAVPGGTQLPSAFQRANFWSAVKGTGYGLTLVPTRSAPIVVDWYPSNPNDNVVGIPNDCNGGLVPVAVLDINEFDSELQSVAAAYATPAQIPVTLADDVAIYVNQNTNECCVLGYHNAISVPGGTQVYATGAYFDTNRAFGPHFADITIWSHEMNELVDDPFVQSISTVPGGYGNDLTPAWGHSGQTYGCQNNLEVGDPLTPDQDGNFPNYTVVGTGGFAYHYQDLAFHDWFYRTPSTSTAHKYSFVGNFSSVQGACYGG
jgi:hypothetical protein